MDGYQQLGQPAARSAAAQEPWDELVHARGRPQIDEPGQDVDEICLRIDSGQLAVPTSSTMWVSTSILDAAIIKDAGQAWWLAETRRRAAGGLPRALVPPAADACRCATKFVGGCKVYDSKEKAGTPWTTTPSGFPKQ